MSSLNLKGLNFTGFARLALAAGLVFSVSACFRPLYGPTASGESLQSVLASIDVPETKWPDQQARIGHYLRSELVYALNGSGSETPKKYILNLSLAQTLSTPIVDAQSGRAQSATLAGNLTYTLTSLDGAVVITKGTATSQATYDRFEQRFASVRAAREAEIRLAKTLTDQVKTRLAATLQSRL
jgi:LPS-assembly lipoprotein